MNKTLALLFLAGIIFCVPKAEAQSARISGNAKTYSGDTLRFYKYADFLTKEKVTVAKAFVDSAGYFSCRPSLDAVTELRIDLDVFEGILYVEPNSDLQITLPKKTQKLQEDALNPFFRAQEFYIKVLNADENTINPNLMKFEQMYGKLIPNLFEGTAGKVNSLKADGLFSAIEDSFAHIPNTFLNNYIKYDLVQLRFVAYKRDKDKIFNTYFSDSTVLFDNNAYNRALYDIFKSYLSNNKKIGINGGLYGDKNFGIMVSTVQKELNFENSELAEYLLLINIYEKFYVDNGLKKTIIDYLKKHRSEIKSPRNRQICDQIISQAGKLIVGNPAPDFILPDKSGDMFGLSKYKGKFVYLNFFNPDSYTCKQDAVTLKALKAQDIDLLEIVTVWCGSSKKEMKAYQKENGFDWTFLYAGDSSVEADYRVVSYPTYYLIHPEGTLLIMPAPQPGSDEFEPMYFYHYRNWKRELIRRENKNPSTNGKSLINE